MLKSIRVPESVSLIISAKSPSSGPIAKIGLFAIKYSNNLPVKIPLDFLVFGINNNKTCALLWYSIAFL
ncbi:MAG: hypothetical protein P8K12_07305 [Polaribacter sp.]|nr:hypothetical protein [Polaribacter sp.]